MNNGKLLQAKDTCPPLKISAYGRWQKQKMHIVNETMELIQLLLQWADESFQR